MKNKSFVALIGSTLALALQAPAFAGGYLELSGKLYSIRPKVFVLELSRDQGLEISRSVLTRQQAATFDTMVNRSITVHVPHTEAMRTVKLPLEPRDPVEADE
jgi:hypothetical protein